MKFKLPQYKVKYHENEQWEEISELRAINELYKAFKKVTQAIKEMIEGEEVKTSNAIYRLKGQ